MKRFVVLDKPVGETPLECMENWRATQSLAYQSVPLTYAGRLDPMASGKLLVLIGDECKRKEEYLGLDKEYEFEVLLGVGSDTGDVLGLIESEKVKEFTEEDIKEAIKKMPGDIELPYPHFSSKTVKGKPLHTWTLENRLHEIDRPTKHSTIYKLELTGLKTITRDEIYEHVSRKIETVSPVTDARKDLGNDFRRPDVRASWKAFHDARTQEKYQVAKFRCIASSGTYMRTLAEVIGEKLGTYGLAYSIRRTKIGHYKKFHVFGFWTKQY